MNKTKCPACVWIAFVALFLLHQDVWFWGDTTLVFGFLPIGLAYHALFSLAAGALWLAATRWAWPHDIEVWAESDAEQGGGV